ncbi:MAG: hypothetical protein HQL72_00420 [Magnetococcales bacterium]|nr:hypothetical protein [Magnetococcales bacterium]
MARFTVLTPLHHDGKRFAPGAVVEMGPDQGAALLRVAALGEPPVQEEGGTGHNPPDAPLGKLLHQLEPNNPNHWTRTGLPRTETLTTLMGRRVSASERNRLWTQWIKEKNP